MVSKCLLDGMSLCLLHFLYLSRSNLALKMFPNAGVIIIFFFFFCIAPSDRIVLIRHKPWSRDTPVRLKLTVCVQQGRKFQSYWSAHTFLGAS